jgi:hypothetical protein
MLNPQDKNFIDFIPGSFRRSGKTPVTVLEGLVYILIRHGNIFQHKNFILSYNVLKDRPYPEWW